MDSSFMSKIRSFLGIRQETPRNDFRNPIWGSDDEDDDDELYSRQQINIYTDPADLHQEFASQMHEMFKTFGSIFGDMKSFFQDDHFDTIGTNTPLEPEHFEDTNRLREYYLKPGFHSKKYQQPKEDVDLDGKISSQEISGLLKQKDDVSKAGPKPFNGSMVPGRSFCQTIITTSVTKPDGTVETKRIIKNGNDVIEETTTSTTPDSHGPMSPIVDPMSPIMNTGYIYNHVMSELSSLFKNWH